MLWAGTIPGGLFRSTDRGGSWSLVRGLWDDERRKTWFGGGYDKPGMHSVLVHPDDPRDSKRIAVAISTGGVWESLDGGDTWALGGEGLRAAYLPPEQAHDQIHQDVHRLVRCQASPDTLWIQHHNGVFASTEGFSAAGASWSRRSRPSVSPSPPIRSKPGTAWFAPAVKDEFRYPVDGKLVVNRTDDGGRRASPP